MLRVVCGVGRECRKQRSLLRFVSTFSFLDDIDFRSGSVSTREEIYLEKLPLLAQNDEGIVEYLASIKSGIYRALHLRSDILHLLKKENDRSQKQSLKRVDTQLSSFLRSALCVDALQLQRITYEESSGLVLEKIARADAVHQIRHLRDMKRRIHTNRRCYALFHPSMPTEPLCCVFVALTPELATSMDYIMTDNIASSPAYSMFYSINSPLIALTGLNIAFNQLKLTSETLKSEFTGIIPCTLSPIPGFMRWLTAHITSGEADLGVPEELLCKLQEYRQTKGRSEEAEVMAGIHALLTKDNSWAANIRICEQIKPIMLWLAYYYIAREKIGEAPLDPVARFHLRNGAVLHQVNWLANPSLSGLKSSAGMPRYNILQLIETGMMVNYMYGVKNYDTGHIYIANKEVPMIYHDITCTSRI